MSGFFSSIKRATSASFDGQGWSGECRIYSRFLRRSLAGIRSDFEVISRKVMLRSVSGYYFDSCCNVSIYWCGLILRFAESSLLLHVT